MVTNEEHGRLVARNTLIVRIFIVISVGILGAILYFVATSANDTNRIVTGIENQQDANTRTVDTSARTLEAVEDCTLPTGKCYRDGIRRTATAVGDIGRVSIYAAACAADPRLVDLSIDARAKAIERCVTRLLEITDKTDPSD